MNDVAATVTVEAGTTKPVAIDCGKAKNAQFSINSTNFSGSALAVNVTSPRTLTFSNTANPSTIGNEAFFAPNAELTFTITYTINDIPKTSAAKTFTLGGAGTASTLTIASNQNGTISVTITYDDAYTDGSSSTINIDGASGEEI